MQTHSASSLKVIVIGNGKVGKSSLTLRYCTNTFSPKYKQTLGVDYLTKKTFIKELGRTFSFYIWDTAGQEVYDAITKRYYRGADAAIIVFSITDRNSYLKVPYWYEKLLSECGSIPTIVVMNKIDLVKEGTITYQEAFDFLHSLKLEIILCSSKDNIRVRECFEKIAVMYFQEHFIVEITEENEETQNNENNNNITNDQISSYQQSTYVYTNNSSVQNDNGIKQNDSFGMQNWKGNETRSFKLKIVKKSSQSDNVSIRKNKKINIKLLKC